jgi:hypothetical protein
LDEVDDEGVWPQGRNEVGMRSDDDVLRSILGFATNVPQMP